MLRQIIGKTAVWTAASGLLLFGAAGTAAWPEGWLFILEMAAGGFLTGLILLKRDPELLAQRLAPLIQEGQPAWDKLFMVLLLAGFFAWFVLMPFDAVRFRWSDMPVWLELVGGVVFPLSIAFSARVLLENSFAAPVVRLQAERGQRVVDTGPYAVVRHPMYAGLLPGFVAIPLLLGSWYGLAAAPLLIAFVLARTAAEDRLLRDGLPGYEEYTRRVRWRLVPGLW